MAGRGTALIVEVPEAEGLVGEWRAKHDPVAVRGIPAHITALFPFVPPGELSEAVLDQLRLLCSTLQPFEYELVEIDRFPEAVWLRRSPDDEFRSLTRSIWRAFPDFPPYGGRFPDSQPHLTIAKLAEHEQGGFVRQLTEAINDRLPVACLASAVSVFVSDGYGVWDRQHRFRLGAAAEVSRRPAALTDPAREMDQCRRRTRRASPSDADRAWRAAQERFRVAICPVVVRAWTRRPRCARVLKPGDWTGLSGY